MREGRQTKHMNPRVWPAPPEVPQPTVPSLDGTLWALVFPGTQGYNDPIACKSGTPLGAGLCRFAHWFRGTDTELPGSATSSPCYTPWAESHPHIQQPQALTATFTSCRSWWDSWLWGSLSFWVIHGCCRTCLAVRRWWGSTCSILDTKSWRHSGQGGDGWGTEEGGSCAPPSATLIANDWKAIASSCLWPAP